MRLELEALVCEEANRVGVHLVAGAKYVIAEEHLERWTQETNALYFLLPTVSKDGSHVQRERLSK